MSDMSEVTKDKLIADVKLVIADSEELLRATAGQAGEKIAEIRARTADRLATAIEELELGYAAIGAPMTTCMTTPGVRWVSPPASASSPAC